MKAHRWSRPTLAALLAGLTGYSAPAQAFCYHSGSTLVAASASPSPLALGCPGAPTWPMWHLFVPPHRAPAPHVGYRPGRAKAVPAIIVHYRCTGFLIQPITVAGHGNFGYVIDMPEHLCN